MNPTACMIGAALALASAVAAAQTPGGAVPDSRTPVIATGRALEDLDKTQRFSHRTISKRQHQPPEEVTMPRPNLAPPPPLSLTIAPIPLPDPRPPALFNKNFPSLHFPREEESGFTERGG